MVLDLFAGTGALGIEALSRGADFAVFVDNYPNALSTISKNIQACQLESRAKILKWNILKNLNCLKAIYIRSCLNGPSL
jgi:16S rRNA (guanine966-N2)-methyltransferase